MSDDKKLHKEKLYVIKIGSALLTSKGQGVDVSAIQSWVKQIAQLREQGGLCIVVTSGSVAVGMQRMGRDKRPHALHDLQALAAIGQSGLIETYESAFAKHSIHTAQILLSHADLANRERYLNAQSTLRALLSMGVMPIINENDSVATEEIRFGDNDTLAAQVANLVEADLLIILTDRAGLFSSDPATDKDARLIPEGQSGDPALLAMAGSSGAMGRGGMRSKLIAAAKAARSGTDTVIADGKEPEVLIRLFAGESIGTHLIANRERLTARKQWLAGHVSLHGSLTLDAGAVKVLKESGRSLLPVGVTRIEGSFSRGEAVLCLDSDGREIARGLVNYDADESRQIMGKASDQIEAILGYVDETELIHRDNMVLL